MSSNLAVLDRPVRLAHFATLALCAALSVFPAQSHALPSQAGTGLDNAAGHAAVELEGVLEVQIEDNADGSSKTRHYLRRASGEVHELNFPGDGPHLLSGTRVRARGTLDSSNMMALASETTSLTTLSEPPAYSAGVQKTAVILVNFQDMATQPFTIDSARSLMGSVDGFFRENSYGLTSFNSDVFGWHTLPISSTSCNTQNIKTYAQSALTASGVSLSGYGRFVYVFPKTSACSWAGLAYLGGNPSDAWINGTFDVRTVSHELGHNLGLAHAHSQNCEPSPIGTTCTGYDYGDVADTMGNGKGHFSAFGKDLLGWLNRTGTPTATQVAASGTYTLEPFSSAPGGLPKALKVPRMIDPNTGEQVWYYLEYRQALGYDSVLGGKGNQTAGVTIRSANPTRGSFLLDMTPNSNTVADTYDLQDGALVPGASFTDSAAGVTITVRWADSSAAAVEVQLASSQDSCKRAAPAVSLSGPSQSVSAGTSVSYTVSVSNKDSSACGAGTFNLARVVPSGWSGSLGSSSLSIAAGSSSTTTLTVTSPVTATVGSYSIGASATHTTSALSGNATATYSVASSGSSGTLSSSVTTSQSVYLMGDTVSATATVQAGGKGVSGATVTFTMTRADGSQLTSTAITSGNGTATYKYRLNKRKDPVGQYGMAIDASTSGSTTSASSGFAVN